MRIFKREKDDVEISRQAMEACEHVIAEMGAELHDDLIQRLSIFRLHLENLEKSLSDRPQAEVLLLTMKSEFHAVIESVRKVSHKLMAEQSENNTFSENLAMICQNMEHPGNANIHFETAGSESRLSPLASNYLSRIVQELIHNAYKHSSAWHIWVRLQWSGQSLAIEVEDDGTGFSKLPQFVSLMERKYNTLRMRSQAIGATIEYHQGKKGLLARVEYTFSR